MRRPVLPPPGQKLATLDGRLDQTYWTPIKDGLEAVGEISGAFVDIAVDGLPPVLGNAATQTVGTSGDAVPLLSTANQWSKQQWFPIATLTDAANIAWDLDTQQTAIVTLGGSRTLANATNAKPGATYQLAVIAGAHVLSFDTMYLFPANGSVPVTVGDCLFSFFCPSAGVLWCVGVKEFA